MTTLVTEELKTTLTQTITLAKDKTYHIKGIKPKLLVYSAPAGTFTYKIKQGGTTLATSNTFTSSECQTELSTSDNYMWLNKQINFPALIALKKGTYDIELSSVGYTYSGNSFLGWVKSHENIFNERTDAYADYTSNPLDVLIYERVREDLIR